MAYADLGFARGTKSDGGLVRDLAAHRDLAVLSLAIEAHRNMR